MDDYNKSLMNEIEMTAKYTCRCNFCGIRSQPMDTMTPPKGWKEGKTCNGTKIHFCDVCLGMKARAETAEKINSIYQLVLDILAKNCNREES